MNLTFFFIFFFLIKYYVIRNFLEKVLFFAKKKKSSLKISDFLSCKFSAFFQLEKNLILTFKKENL